MLLPGSSSSARLAGLLAVLLLLPACTHFNQGLTAYKHGDFQTALVEFRQAAEGDDAEAQHNLGLMYVRGQGTEQNDMEARHWFRKAAEQGARQGPIQPGHRLRQG